MHPTNNIYLLSGPVHSGKTSALTVFVNQHSNVGGFICPDILNLRYLINVSDGTQHLFQVLNSQSENDIQIGQYSFLKSGFSAAHSILLSAKNYDFNFFIIDEIGKLELQGKGLEPALTLALKEFRNTNIIAIVRDYLLEEIIEKYQFSDPIIINCKELNTLFNND